MSDTDAALTGADPLADVSPHGHLVQFYEHDAFLVSRVSSFLRNGLRQGEPVVAICTAEHRALFVDAMSEDGIDVDACLHQGMLTLLDARTMLDRFMDGDRPDWLRFRDSIGEALELALERTGGSRVRAYGEMVDVLWREGNAPAALRLEEFWNDLGTLEPFTLLCAYRMGNFYKEADAPHFARICRAHACVVPTESFPLGDDVETRLREVSVLQQRARALETEVEERKRLEEALREALHDLHGSEAALRRSEQDLRDFVENAAEGLHWVGPDGTILWANRAELELLGYAPEEYVGRSITEFHADREVIDDMLQRLSRNETLRDYPARLRCKDGTIRHVLVNSNVCFESGRFKHTRCFTRDVTARAQMEAALRAADAERERLLAAEQAARAQAEAASRAKDEFLAMLGHELRNPLSPIITALQLMRMRGDSGSPRERAVIERQVMHLVRLVDDLLDISRITRGKVELRHGPLEMADVVAKAVEMASPLLEQRSHCLRVDVPRGKELRVAGDSARLSQVFANLLTNAAKYTDERGRIEVQAARCGQRVRVTVTDDGAGIDPRLMPRIFDLFTQGQQTLDRAQGGLGIGLAVVRNLVELHGGTVSARSEGAGRGSQFTVELPALDERDAEVPKQTTAPQRRDTRELRVLVVDDNADAAEMVCGVLEQVGYQVRCAVDGPGALEVAARFNPEAALLDIGLPVMDGYELGRRLLSRHPGIRLVAITGYGQQTDRDRSAEAGFVGHLVKPVDFERLEELLTRFELERIR